MQVLICSECRHLFGGRPHLHEGEKFCSLSCKENYVAKNTWPELHPLLLPEEAARKCMVLGDY